MFFISVKDWIEVSRSSQNLFKKEKGRNEHIDYPP
jgi:hypothetical protein